MSINTTLEQLREGLVTYGRRNIHNNPDTRVSWQPLINNMSLTEGALINIGPVSTNDIECQNKLLDYESAPFWRRWYWRFFTDLPKQLELYFYAKFGNHPFRY